MHRLIFIAGAFMLFASCTAKPYAPPPRQAAVESLDVILHSFHGRLEAYALVQGRLSSSAAQLVDAEQHRDGQVLYVDVLEQTPRGAIGGMSVTGPPPFQTRIPIEILGLAPGDYVVHVNGMESTLEIPESPDDVIGLEGYAVPGAEANPVITPVPRSAISDIAGTGYPEAPPPTESTPPPGAPAGGRDEPQGEIAEPRGETADSAVVTGA